MSLFVGVSVCWCALEGVSYLPMQNVKVIDNKNFTDLRLKCGPNI